MVSSSSASDHTLRLSPPWCHPSLLQADWFRKTGGRPKVLSRGAPQMDVFLQRPCEVIAWTAGRIGLVPFHFIQAAALTDVHREKKNGASSVPFSNYNPLYPL